MTQTQLLDPIPQPHRKVTYEEFLKGDWSTHHVEWVTGEVVMMAAVSGEHDDITVFLLSIINPYAQAKKLGVVRKEPFQMKTAPHLPGRAPDLMFIANENSHRLQKL